MFVKYAQKHLFGSQIQSIYCLLTALFLCFHFNPVYAVNFPKIDVVIKPSQSSPFVYAKMEVTFTPEYFISLVSKSHENCEWMDNCQSVKILKRISDSELLLKTNIAVPWPFKDRDMVVTSRVEYNKSNQYLVITIEDASSKVPEDKNRVRMTHVYGKWIMKPVNDLFELSYKGSANPEGNVPQSFALDYLKSSTRKTFENLQVLDSQVCGLCGAGNTELDLY